ncbi:uncharacterized protein LOC141692951 [Apium graveolens]|uniref:uncharacterized protein LOC141692951 n=1 Tax=Apium graveolens TaxID=4045 RepID=UPI003D7AB049
MRGRLRVVGDGSTTWAEVPNEYWSEVVKADEEIPLILEPKLIGGSETPEYGEYSIHFTIKLYHGGDLDESVKSYVGGEISYFDMCSIKHYHGGDFGLKELESMCVEVGLKKGDFDLWYCLPEVELSVGLMSIENEEHVGNLTDMLVYTKLLRVYATARTFRNWNCEWDDFSFTQLLVDEKEKRVSQMIDEAEDHIVPIEKEDEDVPAQGEDEEDNDSFQGDNSNLDSTDSEVEKTPKKKKRIPPPNPPYRTRKRGRFSMLRVRIRVTLC